MSNPEPQRLEAHHTQIGGGLSIRRALPHRQRRMIGAWCFFDHAGPVESTQGLRVGPHPHIGLQTFTWMIEGELLHRDSLGSEQRIRPGQVNLMTAGRGIAHSEESLPGSTRLHSAQLWIALPDAHRHTEPAFHHYPELPVLARGGFECTLLAGAFGGARSPAQVHSPLLGLDLRADKAAETTLELEDTFEHGVLVLDGAAQVDGAALSPGTLLYFAPGRRTLTLRCTAAARLLLVGGEPFGEKILLWWNFVARTQAELEQATQDWNAQRRFGEVVGFDGPRLTAPDMAGLHLKV
jgi:quercetin 2,3-dioxygenase